MSDKQQAVLPKLSDTNLQSNQPSFQILDSRTTPKNGSSALSRDTQFSKHKQGTTTQASSSKKDATPVSGSRKKRVSHYEASDDEQSMLEFEKLENQLLKDRQAKNGQQQDSQPPLVQQDQTPGGSQNANTQRKDRPKKKQSTTRTQNGKMANKKPAVKKIEPSLVQPTPQGPESIVDAKKQPVKNGMCFNIFCCGYCCAKGSGAQNEKDKEANLSRPEKRQEIEIKTNKGKRGQGIQGGALDQDASQDQSIIEEANCENQDSDEEEGEDQDQSLIEQSYDEEGIQQTDEKQPHESQQDMSVQEAADEINLDSENSEVMQMSQTSSQRQASQKSNSMRVQSKDINQSIDGESEGAMESEMSAGEEDQNQQESPHDRANFGQTPESQININDAQGKSYLSQDDEETLEVDTQSQKILINQNEESKNVAQMDSSPEEGQEENESDKTQDNDQDQYKMAQAKRMYVIHEVDEETFSERSSKRDKSQVFSQGQKHAQIDQSMNHENINILEELKEENEEDDVYGMNQMKRNQTLTLEADVSGIQMNASQELIDTQNLSVGYINRNHSHAMKQRTDPIRIEAEGTPGRSREKSKTWEDREEENEFLKDQASGRNSKSLLNFVQYMEDQEAQVEQIEQTPESLKEIEIIQSTQQTQQQQQQPLEKVIPQKKTSNFRPQKGQVVGKGAGMSPISPIKQEEQFLIIDDTDVKQQTFTQKQEPKQKTQQQQQVQPSELPQQQPQVIVQKLSVDHSKLSQSYYTNFDSFIVANTLNIDDATKKASSNGNIDLLFGKQVIDIDQQDNEKIKGCKDAAVRKMQERKSLQDQLKQRQVQVIKEKALKKDQERKAKQSCAIKIQKLWKGHQQRKDFRVMVLSLQKVKKFRKICESFHKQHKDNIINGLLQCLKESRQNQDQKNAQLMETFMNMCALQIQRQYRGHLFRKNQLPSLKTVRKAEERFRAFVRAWKIRKVMQTKEIFAMSQYVKDMSKVQEYFLYIEKSDNMMLLNQLKKDRKKAINGFIETIEHLEKTGDWVKSYIGNQIIENQSLNNSTEDGCSNNKTPLKDYQLDHEDGNQMKELITTERFLYDDDISKNPYIFESDEFVRQKFLEKKYKAYENVNISHNNDQFVNQSNLKQNKSKNKLKIVDNDNESSRMESDSQYSKKKDNTLGTNLAGNRKRGQQTTKSENPKDKELVKSSNLTFEQMLENAMVEGDAGNGGKLNKAKTNQTSAKFLKRKEKYDPKKALESKKGAVSNKNIEKKRIFKSKGRNEESADSDNEIQNESMVMSQGGTFKNHPRKSFIQAESSPLHAQKTAAIPSIMQKLYEVQLKTQKFLRSQDGKVIGNYTQTYQPLHKEEQDIVPQSKNNKKQDQDMIILGEEELSKIYQVYHGSQNANQFLPSQTILRDKNSEIPVLKEKALYFTCYDDTVYDSVLDDMKREYGQRVKENRKFMYKKKGK